MRIQMLTKAASATWTASPGEIISRPESEARELVKRGFAKLVEAPKESNGPIGNVGKQQSGGRSTRSH